MTRSRQARRRANRAEVKAVLAQAAVCKPRLVAMSGGNDMVRAGPALWLLPTLRETDGPELTNALAVRWQANLIGRCRCGAIANVAQDADGMFHATWLHEADCPASDEALAELLEKTGRK